MYKHNHKNNKTHSHKEYIIIQVTSNKTHTKLKLYLPGLTYIFDISEQK